LFLRRALRSVAGQTCHDLVHVVVNDGGDLNAVRDEIGMLADADAARVLLVDNQDPKGRESAVNVGLDAKVAPYFAVHDDDDWWEPRFLEDTIAYLETHVQHVAVCVRCDVVREHVENGILVEDEREVFAADLHAITLMDTLVYNVSPPIAQLIRRDVADRIGHWDGSLSVQADWEFTLRLMMAGPIGFIDQAPLAHWSHRPPTEGEGANSIVAEKQSHHDANLQIRDEYLRKSISGPTGATLAVTLTAAEYFRRIDSRLQDVVCEVCRTQHEFQHSSSEHLEAVYASLVKALSEQNQRIDELRQQNSQLHQQIEKLSEARNPLGRFADSISRLFGRGPTTSSERR
jgi:hypothetical protein